MPRLAHLGDAGREFNGRSLFPISTSEPFMRVFRRRYNPIFIEEDYQYRNRRGGLLQKTLFILVTFGVVISALYFLIQ